MSTSTQHYQLTKPDGIDKYSIAVFNANADAIDLAMYNNAQAILTKQDKITGAASSVVSSNLTADRVIITNSSGKIAISSISTTKLGYLNDVTSNIQAQLNGLTTKVNTAQSTADGKVSKSGDVMTGWLTIKGNPQMAMIQDNYTMGTAPSESRYWTFARGYDSTGKKIVMSLQGYVNSSETRHFEVAMLTNAQAWKYPFRVVASADYSLAEVRCVTPSSPTESSTMVATTEWVNMIDNDVVHKSRSEVIPGAKEFTGAFKVLQQVHIQGGVGDASVFSDKWQINAQLVITDKSTSKREIGLLRMDEESNSKRLTLNNMAIVNGKTVNSTFRLIINSSGVPYATAPTTPSTATSNEIATAGWCIGKFVDKSGDYMNGDLMIDKSNPALNLHCSNITKGTNPSSEQWKGLWITDSQHQVLGRVLHINYTSGASEIQLVNESIISGTNYIGCLAVKTDANGNSCATAPSPLPTLSALRNITISTSAPSGGNDGDLWAVYE